MVRAKGKVRDTRGRGRLPSGLRELSWNHQHCLSQHHRSLLFIQSEGPFYQRLKDRSLLEAILSPDKNQFYQKPS